MRRSSAGRQAAGIEAASPRVRAIASSARGWAAAAGGRWDEAVAGFEVAVGLLGLVAPRALARRDQEHLLAELDGLASEAAACCVRAGLPDRAVELFEQGRGILLSQALDIRTDLTALAREHRDLAARFAALRDELDSAADHSRRPIMSPAATDELAVNGARPTRFAMERQREIAEQFDTVVEEIRAQPGFAGFLRPLPARDLAAAAADGPVVIVNVSRHGSHALILTSGGVLEPVALEDLAPDRVAEQVARFLDAIEEPGTSAAQQDLMDVLGWLWEAIAAPVLDHLGLTGPPGEGEPWPQLWWCVSGWLSFLPLHAAGHHQTRFNTNPQTVADRVASSYTPTIRALIHARRTRPAGARRGPRRRPGPSPGGGDATHPGRR